jgi:hypothetical protein
MSLTKLVSYDANGGGLLPCTSFKLYYGPRTGTNIPGINMIYLLFYDLHLPCLINLLLLVPTARCYATERDQHLIDESLDATVILKTDQHQIKYCN